MKNVLIVNFNTQMLTDACIKSINKHTSGCAIYVFDNSDKEPFVNTFDNVTVLDNTKQKIVSFDEVLNRHDKRFISKAYDNNFGSLKHCMSIDFAINFLKDGFVLLDSDVLVKKDFSSLYNESAICCGQEETNSPNLNRRIAPYIMYINSKMCIDKGIRFFDEGHMLGLYEDGSKPNRYDTGSWFYEKIKTLPRKKIVYSQYILHYRAGSWLEDAKAKQHYKPVTTPEKWLEKNKKYWSDEPVKQYVTAKRGTQAVKKEENNKPEPQPVQEEAKVKPVLAKRKIEMSYLRIPKNSDRKIALIRYPKR